MVLALVAVPAITFTSCGGGDDDDSPITPTNKTEGTESSHEWVDLGLSVKWATCNVGATKPEEYGDYFAWGETATKKVYSYSTYTYTGKSEVLPATADVAHVKWGGKWRMPTTTEMDELMNPKYCSWKAVTKNGVKGWEITSLKNYKTIFLPLAGTFGSSLFAAGTYGHYWTSSLYTKNTSYAYGAFLSTGGDFNTQYEDRYNGNTVRAVCPK